MPDELLDMLRHFNGAKLFDKIGPMISVFGMTPATPLDPFWWSPDLCIDTYTPEWRRAWPGREQEWAIAMWCYGALVILDQDGMVKEWEKSTVSWGRTNLSFDAWIEGVLTEGSDFMAET